MSDNTDPVTGKVVPVFFHYAVPSVIGFLAVSSAGIIDGIFIGNFVGSTALAAVNISMPVYYAFTALTIMLAVGGSVMCGKFLGEKNRDAASLIFSKTLYASLAVTALILSPCLLFLDELISALGANEELHGIVRIYLKIILLASPLLVVSFTLEYFVRVDGRPVLASFALVAFAVTNIALDWLFIVQWGWGIAGAAWATAIADASIFIILVSHLFHANRNLSLVAVPARWRDGWNQVFLAAWNGFSEFANEMSIALITLLFNWIMITRLGVEGVAAFTVIGYLLMIGLEICYGISESLQPLVSKNLGARQPERISNFAVVAVISTFVIGLLVSALFLFAPELLVDAFLREGESETEAIAIAFIALFWPAFLFNGANITLASLLTGMHKPLPSAAIAISRSLVLPGLGLLLLPRWFGDSGVFAAIPIAEALTFALALFLVKVNSPSKIVAELDSVPARH